MNVPAASIADLCLVQLQDTKLQIACATPGMLSTAQEFLTVVMCGAAYKHVLQLRVYSAAQWYLSDTMHFCAAQD